MELTELKNIYTAYEVALTQANRKTSILSGLFGQGSFGDPRSHPCNQEFYQKTGQWVAAFSQATPEEASVAEVCRFILEAAAKNAKAPTYWYFLVSQGYVKELIPLLTVQSCRDLCTQYDTLYPKRQRLPLQDEVYAMLARRAGV